MSKPLSLVTGGAGFIGSHIAEHCLSLGHDVAVVDDLSGGFRHNVPSEAIFCHNSITSADVVDGLFYAFRPTYVYHCAAYAAENLSHYIRRFNYENNLIGSVNLINASIRHKVKCFVFTSSMAVYGHSPTPFTESMTPHPCDPYGIAKYAVECDLAAAFEYFSLPYIIFRPHNVYGERQNISDPCRNVVGIFMNAIMQDKPMPVLGDGQQIRAFSYIADVAPIIAKSVNFPRALQKTFNIGGDEALSIIQLASLVNEAMGTTHPVKHLPARNEVQVAFSDHARIRKVFGNGSTVPLREGLSRMAAWARSNVHVQTEIPQLEVDPPRKLWYPSSQEAHG